MSKCLGKNKLLKEKRGLGDCPQGFDFAFHAPLFPKHFSRAFSFKGKNAQARALAWYFSRFLRKIPCIMPCFTRFTMALYLPFFAKTAQVWQTKETWHGHMIFARVGQTGSTG
ncbi:MAG: hypothetical protein HQL75_08195 [Magnetococcales bacterium]|nr:hypothetical protein [Magnetococcales bacterium]